MVRKSTANKPTAAQDWLNDLLAKHVQPVAEQRNWQLITPADSTTSAVRVYVSGNLLLRVVNDRGIVDLEIGTAQEPSSLRAVSFYRDVLDPAPSGHWNLGLSGGVKFVDEQWNVLQKSLAPKSWRETLDKVDAAARRVRGC